MSIRLGLGPAIFFHADFFGGGAFSRNLQKPHAQWSDVGYNVGGVFVYRIYGGGGNFKTNGNEIKSSYMGVYYIQGDSVSSIYGVSFVHGSGWCFGGGEEKTTTINKVCNGYVVTVV